MTTPPSVAQTPKVPYIYIEWIFATDRAIMGHLYLFTSKTGVKDYFTDLDVDVYYQGQTWKSGGLRFEGLARKIAVGANVDEQTLKIWASPTDTLFGVPFLSEAEGGLMDGATVVRYRAIWNFVTGNAAYDVQNNAPLAAWALFTGYIAKIVKGGTSHIEFKVKSPLHKLDVNMPQNYYQPGCLWTLYSAGCTLAKSSFALSGTVAATPSAKTIPVSGGIATVTGADGIAQYAQGRMVFTSGVNNGLEVLLAGNDASNLYLTYMLSNVPAVGDTFTYYPGCSKSFNTCKLKYNNIANFRGFDKVPPVMVSV